MANAFSAYCSAKRFHVFRRELSTNSDGSFANLHVAQPDDELEKLESGN